MLAHEALACCPLGRAGQGPVIVENYAPRIILHYNWGWSLAKQKLRAVDSGV